MEQALLSPEENGRTGSINGGEAASAPDRAVAPATAKDVQAYRDKMLLICFCAMIIVGLGNRITS
jgi:hypothetical protein